MRDKGSKIYKLGNVCDKIGSGATPRGGSEVYQSNGIALIRSQNVYNAGFKKDGLAYISDKHAEELENVTVEHNDILLNITGDSVARTCQVPNEILPARVNQHVTIIRPQNDIFDARYLRYFLVSPAMQNYMHSLASAGATRQALTKGMIEAFEVPCPPLPEQKAIASILGALDNKIELNRKMNETLEAMARTIFKSWFVDFDPIPGLGPHKEWQDSPLGRIPKGWRVGTLGEICENYRRGVKPEYVKSGTPYIGLEHMPRKNIALSEWGIADNVISNKFFFVKGDILFGKLRPYFHKVGVTPIDGVCSTDILVINSKIIEWYSLALSHLSSDDFVNYADGTSSGTKMPRTNWTDMARYQIVIPPGTIARKFTDSIMPMVQTIQSNIHQSHTLASTLDALLSKLLSGEIRVKDAERFVEDKNECFSKSVKHKIRRVNYDREKRRNYKNFRTSN